MTTSNNPYFKLLPINNARTGFKPYAMPVIYIERHRLTEDGIAIGDSETQKIRYYIVDAPDQAKVAGPFNSNLRVPDFSLYEIDLSIAQLLEKKINVENFQFYKKIINQDGSESFQQIEYSEAVSGDYFEYTLDGNGIIDKIEYYKDAYYYDLSSISINVDDLPKPKLYNFVWESTFFRRISTINGNLKCVGTDLGVSNIILNVNHPGDVHYAMLKGTPSLYFNYEGFSESTDHTLEFYRPFADLLQDIFDEQRLLDGINQIDSVPAAFIPYLAYLIGWDLPNYPGVSDDLRRQILKRAVALQKLKGSRRVINELFEMFGFTVSIINLWANKTGNKLLGINDGLESEFNVQIDQSVSNYDASGFTVGAVPLTFIPDKNSDIVIYAYQVKEGTNDYNLLMNFSNHLSNDLDYYNDDIVRRDLNGVITPKSLDELNSELSNDVIGANKVFVNNNTYKIVGKTIINHINTSYDKNENTILLNFDHELSIDGGKLFVFVVYERTKIIIPNDILNTRSSRFDVEIVNKNNDPIDYNLLLYMLSFIFKLKSFHSLLRKIKFVSNQYEVYNVNDFCLSGTDILKPNTDLGDLQVPPAIIPSDDKECESTDRGFKKSDIDLKNIILNGLENEFQGWKNQRTYDSDGHVKGENCELNKEGQDKVFPSDTDFDHNEDDRKTYCEDLPNKPDFCYKGRVTGDLTIFNDTTLKETYLNVPCGPKLGYGVYWEDDIKVDFDHQYFGFLNSRLICVDNKKSTLHYSARPYLDVESSQNSLSLNPASLNIEKEHLGFPSHRFLTMGYLLNDYNYTYENISYGQDLVKQRPWDENSKCGVYDNVLNANLTEIKGKSVKISYNNSTFDILEIYTGLKIAVGFTTYNDAKAYIDSNELFNEQELIWDYKELIYDGNGIPEEIESLTDHTIPTGDERLITHNLYQTTTVNPYVTDDFTVTSQVKKSYEDQYGKIFNSACIETKEDFIAGYASETNIIPVGFNYRYDDPDPYSFIDRSSIASGLGIPLNPIKTEARFFGRSMLFVKNDDFDYQRVIPYRLDCNCLMSNCEQTGDITCVKDESLFDRNSEFDPSPDRIEFDFTALLIEKISLCSRLSNNEIKNMLCINEDCVLPETGSFRYKDDYDIIYELSWIIINDVLDLIFVIKDPKIPGEEQSGYVIDGRVFRKGIITTTRQIIRNYTYIEGEGVEQVVDYYQSNVKCGEVQFTDPFTYGINCSINESVEMIVTDGPMWMDFNQDITSMAMAVGDWKSKGTVWGYATDESEVTPLSNQLIWIDLE